MKLKGNKVGMALGLFVGLMHAIWEIVLSTGNGQKLLDWKFGMHSLNNPFMVRAFDATTATELIIISIIGGYIVGLIFASIWNRVN